MSYCHIINNKLCSNMSDVTQQVISHNPRPTSGICTCTPREGEATRSSWDSRGHYNMARPRSRMSTNKQEVFPDAVLYIQRPGAITLYYLRISTSYVSQRRKRRRRPHPIKITMMLTLFACLLVLSVAQVVQGDTDKPAHGETTKARLPGLSEEKINVKNRKVIKVRSAGRRMELPADNIEQMKNVPFEELSTKLQANRDIILKTHDKFRSLAQPTASNMLKMEWCEEAAATAEAYALKCKKGHSLPEVRKIKNFNCGENIFMAKVKVSWDVVIATWHAEGLDFVYGKGSRDNLETGHYRQLMWGPTYLIGCFVAECPELEEHYNYVCHVCPAGNKGNIYLPYKSGPPCADCPKSCENNLCTNPCPYQNFFRDCTSYLKGNSCGSDESLKKDCPAMCYCTKGEIQ